MATVGIGCDNKTAEGFRLYVIGLSSVWSEANGTVTVNWYLSDSGFPSSSSSTCIGSKNISVGSSQGGYLSVTGLKADTKYYVYCEIYYGSTNLTPNGSKAEVKTEAWYLQSLYLNTISGTYKEEINFQPNRLYRREVKFSTSGTAKFYTTGTSVDTYGYLTTSTGYSKQTGKPDDILKSDDNSGGMPNCLISFEVKPNTSYYIWLRGREALASGTTVLYIVPPEGGGGDDGGGGGGGGDDGGDDGGGDSGTEEWTLVKKDLGSIKKNEKVITITIEKYHMYRFRMRFYKSFYADFYTTGNVDTVGYLTYNDGFPEEGPSQPLDKNIEAFDDNSGDTPNFHISHFIDLEDKDNKICYLWVRGYDYDDVGPVTIHIMPPDYSNNGIVSWSWTESNGSNANARETENAYIAVTSQGYTTNFSHNVWNDMVDKVDTIRSKAGIGWDTYYGTVSEAKSFANSNGEFELTAKMFNSLRNNLELAGIKIGLEQITDATDADKAASGTIPHPVASGNKVFGHYFTTLTDYMNDCIYNL